MTFKLDDVPRVPIDALSVIIGRLSRLIEGNTSIKKLKSDRHPVYIDLLTGIKAAQKAAQRLNDKDVSAALIDQLVLGDETGEAFNLKMERCLDLVIGLHFDDHFVDEVDFRDFEQADIPNSEREEIRKHLNNARDLAAKASFLTDPVRRSVMAKISIAENELYKEKVGYQAFLAAAFETTRLLRRVGEEAQPLAEAIEKARTKTERHVDGYKQIEAAEKPRQIEDKSKDT